MIKKEFKYISGATYNLNILLTCHSKDFGFFDTYEDANNTTITGNTVYSVTGSCESSRLEELRKYSVSTDYSVKYIISTGVTNNGLNLALSDVSGLTGIYKYVYYIDGITYVDLRVSGSSVTSTTFKIENLVFEYDNFDNKPVVKLENKQNMVENPQISKDVFIVRQETSVFENNYRLRAVNSLNDVLTYAGGNYFNIINNT